jgi:hypothetical protein
MFRKNKSKSHLTAVKRTIKFIPVAPDLRIVRAILKKAPVEVICGICNVALNARQGDVVLSPKLKLLFRRHNHHFDRLTDVNYPIEKKRALLTQTGGILPIIPALVGTVLGTLGSEVLSRIFRKNE